MPWRHRPGGGGQPGQTEQEPAEERFPGIAPHSRAANAAQDRAYLINGQDMGWVFFCKAGCSHGVLALARHIPGGSQLWPWRVT